MSDEFSSLVKPQDNVCIADIDSEKHRSQVKRYVKDNLRSAQAAKRSGSVLKFVVCGFLCDVLDALCAMRFAVQHQH